MRDSNDRFGYVPLRREVWGDIEDFSFGVHVNGNAKNIIISTLGYTNHERHSRFLEEIFNPVLHSLSLSTYWTSNDCSLHFYHYS